MNFSTHRFTLDLQKHQSQMSIAAFNYDTAIKLSIGLTDGGVPYYLEDGCMAVLYGEKANGEPIVHTCSIEGNTRIIYEFNQETTNEIGVVNCQIRLYKAGEEMIAAPKFIIVVGERVVSDAQVFDSGDGEFEEQFSALDDIFTKESARIIAENARVEAENVRDGNERIRKEKELARIEFETQRQTKEAERVKAEEARDEAEIKREEGYAQLDTKFAKRKAYNPNFYSALGYTNSPEETTFALSGAATPNSIVFRDGSANFKVKNPTDDAHPTPRGYVDGLVNLISEKQTAIEERVSDLESLTLSYPEIASTDYEKSVPAEVGKYALVKSIGGASKKVSSNNLLNPMDIIKVEGRGGETIDYPFTVNGDTITFTVTQENLGANIYFDTSSLGTGKYHVLCELNGGSSNGVFYSVSENEEVIWWVEISKPEGEQYPNWYPDEFTFNCKLAIYKAEDSDTLEFVDAPEGTVFEPYGSHFENAEVEKIESIGANLFDGRLIKYATKFGLTITYDSETQIFTLNGTTTSSTEYAGTYINLKGEKGKNYLVKTEIVGGVIDKSGKTAVAYFASADTPNTRNNWSSSDLGFSMGRILALPHEYITHFWFYIEAGITFKDYKVKIMLARVDKDIPYKPYRSEPIDTFAIPVDAIKAKTEVKDFGKGIDATDYNYIECIDGKWQYVRKCRELVLTGNEQYITAYGYGGMNGISIQYLLDANYNRQKAICTDTDKTKESDITINSMWIGANDNKTVYWVGILDYLGLSNVDEFRAYLTKRYESGNPVRIIYKLATPIVTDITDLFTEDNSIEVEGGGSLRLVNDNEMPVPNTVAFVTRKG